MAGYVPDVDAFSMLSGIGDTLQKNQQQKDAPALISALLGGGTPAPQQPGIFGQIVNGAKNIFAPQPQAQTPTPVVNQRPVSTSTAPIVPTGFDSSVNRTLGFEGGLNPNDSNGTPSNYGINQAAHPDIDVTKISSNDAKGIYKSQYWDPIGGDQLPPALAHVAFDTAVMSGPAKAQELLQQSGGDPQKLLALRANYQQQLLQSDPQKYGPYAQAWSDRNKALASDVAASGSSGGPMAFAGAQPPTSPAPGLSPSTPLPGTGYTAVPGYAGGTPAPQQPLNIAPNAQQQPTPSPALPTAPQGVPSVGSTQTPMGQQIPPLSTEALSRALTNPYTKDLAQGLLTKYAQPNTIQTIGNTVYSVNARTNTLTPLMQVPKEPTVQELPVTGADGTMTGTQKYWVSPDKAPVPLGGVDTSKMKTQFTPMTDAEATAAGFNTKQTGPVYKDENGKPYLPAKPNSSVVFGQESASDKAIGEAKGKVVADAIAAGSTAGPRLRSLGELNDALQSGGNDISTGPLAEGIKAGKQFLSNIAGEPIAGLPQSEVIQKVGFGLATQLTKAISQRPAQSEFLKALENVPGLYQSKAGMQALVSINTQEAQQDRDLSRIAMKTKADDWPDARDAYYDAHPLISPFTGKPFGAADIPIVTGNNGSVVPGPNGNAPMAQPQLGSVPIPMPAASYLKANPSARADFDQKYGAGASDKVLGPAR